MHLASVSAVFCLCMQKLPQCVKSLGFLIQRAYQRTVPVPLQKKRTVPTYLTRTIPKKAYRTSVPYFLAKIEAYRTYVPYRTVLPSLPLKVIYVVGCSKTDKNYKVKLQSITQEKILGYALWKYFT